MSNLIDSPPLEAAKDVLEGVAATYWLGKAFSKDPHHVDEEDSKGRIIPTVKVHNRAEHATVFAGMWGAANVAWYIIGIPVYCVLVMLGFFATVAWFSPIYPLITVSNHQFISHTMQIVIVAMIVGAMLISTLLMRPKGKWIPKEWVWLAAVIVTIASIAGFLTHVKPGVVDGYWFHSFGVTYGFLGFWLFVSWVKVIVWPLIKIPFKWLINHGPAISYGEGYGGPLGTTQRNHRSVPEPVHPVAHTYEPSPQIPPQM